MITLFINMKNTKIKISLNFFALKKGFKKFHRIIFMKDSSKCGLRIISLLSLESEVICMTKREEIFSIIIFILLLLIFYILSI